jgi:hypothetical protein
MSTNFQTVTDSLYALATIIGITVVFALAIIGAAAATRRSQARNSHAGTPATATMAQHPVQTDDTRELVLR